MRDFLSIAAATVASDCSDVVSQPFRSQTKSFSMSLVRASVRLLSDVVQAWHGRASTLESRRGWCMGLVFGGQDASGTSRIYLGRSGRAWSMICVPRPLPSYAHYGPICTSCIHILQTFVN